MFLKRTAASAYPTSTTSSAVFLFWKKYGRESLKHPWGRKKKDSIRGNRRREERLCFFPSLIVRERKSPSSENSKRLPGKGDFISPRLFLHLARLGRRWDSLVRKALCTDIWLSRHLPLAAGLVNRATALSLHYYSQRCFRLFTWCWAQCAGAISASSGLCKVYETRYCLPEQHATHRLRASRVFFHLVVQLRTGGDIQPPWLAVKLPGASGNSNFQVVFVKGFESHSSGKTNQRKFIAVSFLNGPRYSRPRGSGLSDTSASIILLCRGAHMWHYWCCEVYSVIQVVQRNAGS